MRATHYAEEKSIKQSKYALIPKSTGAFKLINMDDIKYVTMSILIYLDESGNIINNSGKVRFPGTVILYNKNYPINDFRTWLQAEFHEIDHIENIKIPKNKIVITPKLSTLLLNLIITIYPFMIVYYTLTE